MHACFLMYQNPRRARFRKRRNKQVRIFNHQVYVKNRVRNRFAQRRNHRRPQRDVRHEVSVHHVHVQQRAAAFERQLGVGSEIREIRRKYGRRQFYLPSQCFSPRSGLLGVGALAPTLALQTYRALAPEEMPLRFGNPCGRTMFSISDFFEFAPFSRSMRWCVPKIRVSTPALFSARCFRPTIPARTSRAKLPPALPAASLYLAARRARFRKTSGNLRAASEPSAACCFRNQTAPAFPTLPLFQRPNLHRPPVFPRAAVLPADRVPASRNFPLLRARENAAAESAPASSMKDKLAIRSHNKTSRRMHRRSARHHVPRECPQATSPADQKASTRDRASAAQGRKTLLCPAPASLSTNHGSPVCTGRRSLQIESRAPIHRPKSFSPMLGNRRRAVVPDKRSEILRFSGRAQQALVLPQE